MRAKPEPSALRNWVTVLGFLAAVLIVLGGVGYGVRWLAHSGHATMTSH